MEAKLKRLGDIFRQMVHNSSTFGESWKNIRLGREAFALMKSLPDILPGEYERTGVYEAVIADVEAEVAEALHDVPRGMGFCFAYWGEKQRALGRRGIQWLSPALVNPNVMFD